MTSMTKKLFSAELRRLRQAGIEPARPAFVSTGIAREDVEALREDLRALDAFLRDRLGDPEAEQQKVEEQLAREAAEMSALEKQRQEVELLKDGDPRAGELHQPDQTGNRPASLP